MSAGARSYTLDQFKAQMESEAMKRCEQQAATIKKPHEQIHGLQQQVEVLTEQREALCVENSVLKERAAGLHSYGLHDAAVFQAAVRNEPVLVVLDPAEQEAAE